MGSEPGVREAAASPGLERVSPRAGLSRGGLWGGRGSLSSCPRSELGRGSAHQSSQHCGALASGYRLEIEELGAACGVLRGEMGSKGVSLFSCFNTLQFGLLFHY